jgi:hypothetical protein
VGSRAGPTEEPESWTDALKAVEELHRGLAAVERPKLLDSRGHLWARADRFAWQESSVELVDQDVVHIVGRCLAAYRPLDLPSQLVHGDTYNNLLFADGLTPAVIDFSPYWRPAPWARAVYVIDGLWRACERDLLQLVIDEPSMDQLLLRAEVFRLVSDDLLTIELGRDNGPFLAPHPAIIELLADVGII